MIDTRPVPFDRVWKLVVGGPLVAIAPYELTKITKDPGPLGFARLKTVAAARKEAGAAVHNLLESK